MITRLIPLLFVLACSLFAEIHAQAPPLTHRLTAIEPRPPAPVLHLPDMDEEAVDLAAMQGRAVVVNFWATWCPPCRREMGSMERLYQAMQERGVEVLAVNIGEDMDTVFSFLGTIEPSPNFRILFDAEGASMSDWKVMGLPTTFIVDPDGNIAYRAVGGREFDHPNIVGAIEKLLQ